jgi:hypothetical protein
MSRCSSHLNEPPGPPIKERRYVEQSYSIALEFHGPRLCGKPADLSLAGKHRGRGQPRGSVSDGTGSVFCRGLGCQPVAVVIWSGRVRDDLGPDVNDQDRRNDLLHRDAVHDVSHAARVGGGRAKESGRYAELQFQPYQAQS